MGDLVNSEDRTIPKRNSNVNVLVTGFGQFRHTTRNPSWETAKSLSKQGFRSDASRKVINVDISYIPVEYTSVIAAISYFYGLSDVKPELPSDMVDDIDIAARDEFEPQKRYDLILHIGQGRSGGIQVETIGHQLGYRLLDAQDNLAPIIGGTEEAMDADSKTPEQSMTMEERSAGLNRGYPISDDIKASLGHELQLQTAIDTDALVHNLSQAYPQFQINKSTNAGRYLCEYIYFGSLAGSIAQHNRDKTLSHGETVHKAKVLFIHVPPENDPLSIQDMVTVTKSVIQEITAGIPGGR